MLCTCKKQREGQNHPKAELTDGEVDRMRQLHEEHPPGHPQHIGYRRLARTFEVPIATVKGICRYRTRS